MIEDQLGSISDVLWRIFEELNYDSLRAWKGAQARGKSFLIIVAQIEKFIKKIGCQKSRLLGLEICEEQIETFKLPESFSDQISNLLSEIQCLNINEPMLKRPAEKIQVYRVKRSYKKITRDHSNIDYETEWLMRLQEKNLAFGSLKFEEGAMQIFNAESTSEKSLKWTMTCPVIGCEKEISLLVSLEPVVNFRCSSYVDHLKKHVSNITMVKILFLLFGFK